jgi:hypothetical protein
MTVLDDNRFIETILGHQPGVPFLGHSPLAGHYQHGIARQQSDKGKSYQGNAQEGGNNHTKLLEKKGQHLRKKSGNSQLRGNKIYF